MIKHENYIEFKNVKELLEVDKETLKGIITIHNVYIDNGLYTPELIGGEKENCYIIFTNNKYSNIYFRIDYTLFKIAEDHYKGINEIKDINFYEA